MKKHLYIGLIIAALAFYYTFRNVSLEELGGAFGSMHFLPLIPALIIYIFSYYAKVVRWKFLILSVKDVHHTRLISPMMVGFMSNMLPARVGELIRAYLLGKREDIPFSSSFATIVLERLFDMVSILAMFGSLLLFQPDLMSSKGPLGDPATFAKMKLFGWSSLIIVTLLVVFSFLLIHKKNMVISWLKFLCRPFPETTKNKILDFTYSFADGLMVLKDFKTTCIIILLSGTVWSLSVLAYYPFYYAFDIGYLPFSSIIILFVTICLFITIFPTPGYVGSFQAACMLALHDLFGVSEATAASFGITTWAFSMGFVIVAGLYFVFKDNISVKELMPVLNK